MKLSFIIIDDRELDCYIAEKIIEKTGRSADCKSFYNAKIALDYLKNHHPTRTTVILLDIMMPVMNGFAFIEEFEAFPQEVKDNYRIVPITTSLNKNDISTMGNYTSVVKVLRKPYTFDELTEILDIIQAPVD